MPKVITLTNSKLTNIHIAQQGGERRLIVQYQMTNAEKESVNDELVFGLDSAQEAQIRSFLKPFIDQIRDDTDIAELDNFVDP